MTDSRAGFCNVRDVMQLLTFLQKTIKGSAFWGVWNLFWSYT